MKTIDFLQSALEALGYKTHHFTLGKDSKSFTQFEDPHGGRFLTMSTDSPLYPFASSSARVIANHKDIAYDFAMQFDVPIPQSVTVLRDDVQYDSACELLSMYGRVIVKPNVASVSNGLTLNIADEQSLAAAIEAARHLSADVLVQRQVAGEEIRFVVAGGKVRAAILRQTPGVVGNGTDTVAQLIESENAARSQITNTAVPYPAIDGGLVDLSAVAMDVVPAKNERIQLGLGTMIKTGASIYDITDRVHASYLEVAEKLGAALGPGFVVVDMMLVDYAQPATRDNYAFIEFNLTPALQLFYSCRDGRHFDVARKYIAPMIDAQLKEV